MTDKSSEPVFGKIKPILSDHKREGKRFISPIAQKPSLDFISWVKEIMPNVLSIALLLGTCLCEFFWEVLESRQKKRKAR